MKFCVPIRLPSLANMRSSWRVVRLKKRQKTATFACMRKMMESATLPSLPLVITITRIGPRRLDDDNLAAACKYVRDQIAAIVGTDDGSSQYTWQYHQRIGEYGVEVDIQPRAYFRAAYHSG